MRVLKIQDKWLRMILSGKKTMEVRSQNFNIVGLKIGLGNSRTWNVEGYATVTEKIKIPFSEIMNYQNEHLATLQDFKELGYDKKEFLYGYRLTNVTRESNPFPYPKNRSIWSNIWKAKSDFYLHIGANFQFSQNL